MHPALVAWGQAALFGNTFPLTHTDTLEFTDVGVTGIRRTLPSLKSRDDRQVQGDGVTHTHRQNPHSSYPRIRQLQRPRMFLPGPNPARRGISAAGRAVTPRAASSGSHLSPRQDGTGVRAGVCRRDQAGSNNATKNDSAQRKSLLLTEGAAAICLISSESQQLHRPPSSPWRAVWQGNICSKSDVESQYLLHHPEQLNKPCASPEEKKKKKKGRSTNSALAF